MTDEQTPVLRPIRERSKSGQPVHPVDEADARSDEAPIFVDGVPRHAPSLVARYTSAGYWGEQTISDRLRSAAADRSQHTAIVDGSRRLSYAEFAAAVSAVANAFRSFGVRRGDAVAVQLPNWWEQLVADFAIIEIGAVLVPVNARVRGELEYMLEYTHCKVLVIPDEYHGFSYVEYIDSIRPRLPDLRSVVVARGPANKEHSSFADLASADRKLDHHPALEAMSANDPWQIMFTSGTTSAPKGVVRTHNNTLFTLDLLINEYQILQGDGSDVALAVLPVAFVYAQYLCALGALLTGGTLVLQENFDAADLVDLVEKERVTLIGVVPSMVPVLQHVPNLAARDLSSLRIVAPAGEAVTRERKVELSEIFRCDVRECYGLAEVTMPLVQPAEATLEQRLSTTGRPNPATDLAIIDDDGGVVNGEGIGELLVKGPTLFSGYYRNPEATTNAIDGNGWFHTGDLVKRGQDGFYAISGRKKDLIKRGGASILPQDIEDALEGHPAVKAVAAFGLPDDRRGEIACACVVLNLGASTTVPDLLAYLRDRIATFKVPERIEFVDSLPLSANGKVLKAELAARLSSGAD
ncbi:MAG TPA: class I adenylate-forming enzyme family protein [Candidatus Dormibacteraeota bacterium]|nr:class I adenylate-forming enzyme family protein [Candidatus Dormibacteraeota bacterium]